MTYTSQERPEIYVSDVLERGLVRASLLSELERTRLLKNIEVLQNAAEEQSPVFAYEPVKGVGSMAEMIFSHDQITMEGYERVSAPIPAALASLLAEELTQEFGVSGVTNG